MDITETITARIGRMAATLTPTEQRIARLVGNDPELVAFGTAASVAKAAGTSAPSIVRFAAKLGLAGFSDLQSNIRQELSTRISSAYKRARDAAARQDISAWIEIEMLNIKETLSAIDRAGHRKAVSWLADPGRRIFILASEQWSGPATTFHDFMRVIRPRLHRLNGSPFRVASELGLAERGDVLLTMDAQRNESWVVKTHELARSLGLKTIAITEGPQNPIAANSDVNFRVSQATCGLFDSKTGLTALLDFLLDAVAREAGESVVKRLEHMEALWTEAGLLD